MVMTTVKELADLCADALVHAGLIVNDTEFEKVSGIIEEEINVRMSLSGIYIQPELADDNGNAIK